MGEAEHEVGNSPSRVFLTADELESADKEQFLQHWYKQEQYINSVESKLGSVQSSEFLLSKRTKSNGISSTYSKFHIICNLQQHQTKFANGKRHYANPSPSLQEEKASY